MKLLIVTILFTALLAALIALARRVARPAHARRAARPAAGARPAAAGARALGQRVGVVRGDEAGRRSDTDAARNTPRTRDACH